MEDVTYRTVHVGAGVGGRAGFDEAALTELALVKILGQGSGRRTPSRPHKLDFGLVHI